MRAALVNATCSTVFCVKPPRRQRCILVSGRDNSYSEYYVQIPAGTKQPESVLDGSQLNFFRVPGAPLGNPFEHTVHRGQIEALWGERQCPEGASDNLDVRQVFLSKTLLHELNAFQNRFQRDNLTIVHG
jgi:hypothetical protein